MNVQIKKYLALGLCLWTTLAIAQVDLDYQKPDNAILDLVDAPLPPSFRMNTAGTKAILLYRKAYKSIAELSETEMRLAGLRINPQTNISSRQRTYFDMKVMDVQSGKVVELEGLPENARMSNFLWSKDEAYMAFTHTEDSGVSLWVLDVGAGHVMRLTQPRLNANMGMPMVWLDGSNLLVRVLSDNKSSLIDKTSSIPVGPTVSVNEGKKAQNRTYQDLLKDKIDERNFETLATSMIVRIHLDGTLSDWAPSAMYRSMSLSPDGRHVLVTTIHKPFSYLVPYYRFPSRSTMYKSDGTLVKTMLEIPLIEDLPKGFMARQKGPRQMSWRDDKPASVYWVEALDEGDPAIEVPFRDAVYNLDAPFDGDGQLLIKTVDRFSGILWGNESRAIAYDYWWNNRNTRTYLFNPSDPDFEPEILTNRNYQDRYNDPGDFVTVENEFARTVLDLRGDDVHLIGDGYSDEGIRPFVDKLNLKTKVSERLYRADGKTTLENILRAVDVKNGIYLTRIESPTDYPNYYFRNVHKHTLTPVTSFDNPFQSFQNVRKELITYHREDGVELSATLYLPPGYREGTGEKLPMLMWAYPREYKDKSSAGQVTTSANEFTYPWYGSPVFWVMRGYAVLDDAAFPIVGEGEEEPNDSFRTQLVSNAKAAIDAVDAMGYIDRNRVGVGGHSYGAFMTANLLSHSDLFAAGIARSGAYNRTLTPFGFQSEERNYWEAPEVYYTMSPFMHADKMKTPLLLIHGEADNNSGTYPMQSERYFNALKGLGATVRLVMLPKESHGYAARESILHVLWEQDTWLEKWVKNKGQDVEKP